MKQLIFTLAGMLLMLMASANQPQKNTEEINSKGIVFIQDNWSKAVELAKKENKLIFLDVYTSWCGYCKKIKKNTFSNDEVAKFYNSNFINLSVNAEKGEGIKLAEKYAVRRYPGLLFINKNEEIVLKKMGNKSPHQFIKIGKEALKKQ